MSADPNAVISEVAKGGHELKKAETVDKSAPVISREYLILNYLPFSYLQFVQLMYM
jgi:hypothetical protein